MQEYTRFPGSQATGKAVMTPWIETAIAFHGTVLAAAKVASRVLAYMSFTFLSLTAFIHLA